MRDRFQYLEPSSLDETISILAGYGRKSEVLAGGTDLLVRIKKGLGIPEYLINIKRIHELNSISFDTRRGLVLGALVRLSDLESSEVVQNYFPSLADASGQVGSPQIRNRATVGGNICQTIRCLFYHQSSYWRKSLAPCIKLGGRICNWKVDSKVCTAPLLSDVVPVLMALNSEVNVLGINGLESVSILDFSRSKRLSRVGKIVKEIRIPLLHPLSGTAFVKHRARRSIDYPVINAAATVRLDRGSYRCMEAKVVVGAVGPFPLQMQEIEEMLKGFQRQDANSVKEDLIQKIVKIVGPYCSGGLGDFLSPAYHAELAGVAAYRAIEHAFADAERRSSMT